MRTKVAAMLAGSSLLALVSPALAQPAPTQSQNQQAAAEDEEDTGDEEIVVTGTFIRGVAPTGNQVLGVTQEDIQATAAASSNDLLANVPQTSMFNDINAVGITSGAGASTANQNTQIQVQRPTLRNIGSNTAGSSPTLLLMDGHRIVGAGATIASPDAGVIPPGVVERVEIVTDGGTALYGTDAVGGVINFITRRSYDGIRLTGRYGMGDEYDNTDLSLTAGTDWGSGSVYGSINYNAASPLFGYNTDWYKDINWNDQAPFGQYLQGSSRQCDLGNVSVGSTNYAINTGGGSIGAINSFNACRALDYQTISPDQETTSLFAGFSQEFTDAVELQVRGFFTKRESLNGRGPFRTAVRVDDEVASPGSPGQSPYYLDVPGAGADGAVESVNYAWGPVSGNGGGNGLSAAYNNTEIEEWGTTATLTVDLPAEWQLNLVGNYGWSDTFFRNHELNGPRQQYYATGGTVPTGFDAPLFVYNTTVGPTGNNINPYNIAASNPSILADIQDWQRYGEGEQELVNYRAVFDGPLLALPGGEVRGAFGAEYIEEEMSKRGGFTRLYQEGLLPTFTASRHVQAFFGELNIPVIGEGNNFPLVQSLTLALSARHDDYSDFGETTNPQVGLVWEVVDWFSLRGNWGTSFNAPSPLEVVNQAFPTVQVNQIAFNWGGLANPGTHGDLDCFLIAEGGVNQNGCSTPYTGGNVTPASAPGQFSIALDGAAADLKPQTGETWSVGFDSYLPFMPNLRLSATYYNIAFEDTLGSFNGVIFAGGTASRFASWPNSQWLNGANGVDGDGSGVNGAFTTNDILAFCALSSNPTTCNSIAATPNLVYQLADTRFGNFGASKQEGVDVSLRYSHDFDWATLDASVSGNYRLTSSARAPGSAVFTETDLDATSRYRITTNVGLTVDNFYGRVTVNYSDGFPVNYNNNQAVTSTSTGPFQYHVDPFMPVDLFLRYEFGDIGLADNLQLTFNVDNVFDENPPLLKQSNTGSNSNGTTLGRVVSVGFTADF